ncbi:MAG: hypothetical protein IT233_11070 [Bacteroidia bacterium]|nr:hypothetical protein [Bacteroidia bacterium]
MRTFWTTIGLSLAFAGFSQNSDQSTVLPDPADSTGLPGDHFSLEGALEMFKKASSLEDFEKKLNDPANNVNNLDLNNDGKVDYVRVIDKMQDKIHAIVLQVPVNEKENQDIAVIEIEKDGDASASLQIVGDEELYGDSVFVEPVEEDELKTNNTKDGKGPSAGFGYAPRYVIVNVWGWPCVQYIYAPAYVVWVSPWYWGYWPGWWSPWACHPWRHHWYHCHHHHHYHHHYWRVHNHRMHHVHNFYHPHRVHSPSVNVRYKANHTAYGARKKSYPPKVNRTPPTGKTYGAPKNTAPNQKGNNGKQPVKKTSPKSPKTSKPPVKKNSGKAPGGGPPKSKGGGGKKGR